VDVDAGESRAGTIELRCPRCGYGAVCRRLPERCPICGGSDWSQVQLDGGDSVAPLCRAVNRRVRELDERHEGPVGFMCECGERCFSTVELTVAEFDLALDEGAYIVTPGHEKPGAELIDRTARYVLVAR
jgi:hypothetical protein